MKVKIANLGVIEEAEIDLKPLTVFIGRNGTGKTWTAYTLASIFSFHGFERYWKMYLDKKTHQRYPTIDNAIEQFIQEGNVKIDIIKFVEEYAERYINDVASLTHSWMRTFLATKRSNFETLKVKFNLAEVKKTILEYIKTYSLHKEFFVGSQNKLNVLKEFDENSIHFYLTSEEKVLNKLPKKILETFLIKETFNLIHKSFYPKVYIFPTERTSLITVPYEKEIPQPENIDVPEYKDGIDFDTIYQNQNNKNTTKLSVPMYFLYFMLVGAYQKHFDQREYEVKNLPDIGEYINLAELLETEILQGKLEINESILTKEIIFQPKENIKTEINAVSSMVKELASLVLYLRYMAAPNELLIIDEPEMNLHPAAQIEITEFLAMLVNSGLNVMITTHSPYIVDHLINLMKAAKSEDQESLKERFYLEKTEAFIPQEKVSVYLFEDGTAKNILHENGRIDWSTFGQISEDVARIIL